MAKLLKVPSGTMAIRHVMPASWRTTAPTVPSPPATTTLAFRVTSVWMRFTAAKRNNV